MIYGFTIQGRASTGQQQAGAGNGYGGIRTTTINEEYRSAYHGGHKNGQRAACAAAQLELPGSGETGGESGGVILNVLGVNSLWGLCNSHDMFLFAFHACGLRVVDVMTLQWSNIDFNRKELRKIMIKTGKRHIIPLTDPAIGILNIWKEKRGDSRYVFDLVKDNLDIDNDEALYKARNNATKCINQSLTVVGEALSLKFPLTMHVARHTFAVFALNKGLSMSVVSRLLGHGSTDITEKVYARFLPETLSSEVARLAGDINSLSIV